MHTKKERKNYLLVLLLCILYSSCSSIDFELPQGPQGPNGKSAYEIWKEEVEAGHIDWPSDKINLTDFLVYIKGEKETREQTVCLHTSNGKPCLPKAM